MSRVRSKDTLPEVTVRSALHRLGYRFRLHRRDLPGSPDIVFPAFRSIILVHGCFWHGHRCRAGQAMSKSNVPFWREKIEKNMKRDDRNVRKLRRLGWRLLTVWECQVKKDKWLGRATEFLDCSKRSRESSSSE
jgi:DNA mismatch endonuclease (patch repair protein)